jgi:hypothetical protein
MNGKQKMVVVLMDLLLLTELCVSVYISQHSARDVTSVFLTTFLPAMLITVALARIAIRLFRAKETAPEKIDSPQPVAATEN